MDEATILDPQESYLQLEISRLEKTIRFIITNNVEDTIIGRSILEGMVRERNRLVLELLTMDKSKLPKKYNFEWKCEGQ